MKDKNIIRLLNETSDDRLFELCYMFYIAEGNSDMYSKSLELYKELVIEESKELGFESYRQYLIELALWYWMK